MAEDDNHQSAAIRLACEEVGGVEKLAELTGYTKSILWKVKAGDRRLTGDLAASIAQVTKQPSVADALVKASTLKYWQCMRGV